jgi:hypothetical protein
MACARSDAEAVSGETARNEEAGKRGDFGDDGNAIRRRIDDASPALGDFHAAECRKAAHEVPFPFIENGVGGSGVERAHRLERRLGVERPGPRDPPLLQEAPADAEAQFVPLGDEGGEEVQEQPEAVRHQLGNVGVPPRDGVAAVAPLAKREVVGAGGAIRSAFDGIGPHH